MKIGRATKHAAGALIEGVAYAAIIALLVAGTAFAAKPGTGGTTGGKGTGGSGSTLSVVMVVDNNGNGAPNWNDVITFKVVTSVSTPTVVLSCAQNGVGVLTASAGFYPSYAWPANYTLASTMWTGGAASCVATLKSLGGNGKWTTVTSMSFDVGA